MHSPILTKIAKVHRRAETVLLERLVLNLRERHAIEVDICHYCSLREAYELLIEAEEIVRKETRLVEVLEDSVLVPAPEFVRH